MGGRRRCGGLGGVGAGGRSRPPSEVEVGRGVRGLEYLRTPGGNRGHLCAKVPAVRGGTLDLDLDLDLMFLPLLHLRLRLDIEIDPQLHSEREENEYLYPYEGREGVWCGGGETTTRGGRDLSTDDDNDDDDV